MADISMKALVDKIHNKVIFVESNEDFVDVLFSFLTMPIGTIVRLTRNQQQQTSKVGCMNNLYESVENLDTIHLRTEACKTMLLHPRNGAEDQCKKLRLRIDDSEPLEYFSCRSCLSNSKLLSHSCLSNSKLLSHYKTAICNCGSLMDYNHRYLYEKKSKGTALDAQERGVFVKGPNQLIVTDELKVMPSSTATSFSLFSKLGIVDTSSIEKKTISMGVGKALNLLNCSLLSKQPLTETLLDQNPISKLSIKEDFEQVSFTKPRFDAAPNQLIHVKLMVSKTRKRVYYAEASENFVNLLFSFLTVPLGFIAKQMRRGTSKGSICHLYDSIQDLDASQYLVSKEKVKMLVNPKLAPGFGYEGQPLDIKEYNQEKYYYNPQKCQLWVISDEKLLSSGDKQLYEVLTVKDPKSQSKERPRGRGFVMGPAMFTITDDLIVTPMSAVSGLAVLSKFKVPFSDIEERTAHVGETEALRLLLASYCTSESALTNVFMLSEQSK